MKTKTLENIRPGDVLIRKIKGSPTLNETARVALSRTRPLLIREHRMEYKNVEPPVEVPEEFISCEKLNYITQDVVDGFPYHKQRTVYHFCGFACDDDSMYHVFKCSGTRFDVVE